MGWRATTPKEARALGICLGSRKAVPDFFHIRGVKHQYCPHCTGATRVVLNRARSAWVVVRHYPKMIRT